MKIKIRNSKVAAEKSSDIKKPLKIAAISGCGTFAVHSLVKASKIAVDGGSSGHMSYGIGVDNNLHSVNKAAEELERLRPSLFKRMADPFYKYAFQTFVEKLPAIRTAIGFDRNLEKSLESIKIFRPAISEVVKNAKECDLAYGNTTAIHLRPTSLSGGHAGPAQWTFNHEMNMQGLDGIKIGLGTIPEELMSLRIFKQIFPLMLASKRYGFDAWVLWDNNLANLHRPAHIQDELVLKGLFGTLSAFTWGENQPGPGDIWNALSKESNGFVGVSAIEEQLSGGNGRMDRETLREVIRRGMLHLFSDSKTKLLDAEMDKGISFVVVVGNITYEDYFQVMNQIIVPKNTVVLYSPSNSNKITLVRFSALKGRIRSVEHLWNIDRPKQGNSYRLPNSITEKSIKELWPMVETVADYAGVSPELLLEGN